MSFAALLMTAAFVAAPQDHTMAADGCAYVAGTSGLVNVPVAYHEYEHRFLIDGQLKTSAEAGFSEASRRPWFVYGNPIDVDGRAYVKYGLPRVIGLEDLRFLVEYDGAPVMVDRRESGPHEVIYVLRDSLLCEFQPYQLEY